MCTKRFGDGLIMASNEIQIRLPHFPKFPSSHRNTNAYRNIFKMACKWVASRGSRDNGSEVPRVRKFETRCVSKGEKNLLLLSRIEPQSLCPSRLAYGGSGDKDTRQFSAVRCFSQFSPIETPYRKGIRMDLTDCPDFVTNRSTPAPCPELNTS